MAEKENSKRPEIAETVKNIGPVVNTSEKKTPEQERLRAGIVTERKTQNTNLKNEAEQERFRALAKQLEQYFFTISLYPVAAKEDAKNEAKEKIKEIYEKEDDSIKQLVLYMLQEKVTGIDDMKNPQNFEYYKKKFPAAEPAQIRLYVYKAMFHYHYSLEGSIELLSLLGELGDDDSAKVLSHIFTHTTSNETELSRMLRNAVIEALGESSSSYALRALLSYVRYSDNEKLVSRIAAALSVWQDKIPKLNIPKKEKERLLEEIDEILLVESTSATPNYR